jgi:hypothetical protein
VHKLPRRATALLHCRAAAHLGRQDSHVLFNAGDTTGLKEYYIDGLITFERVKRLLPAC